MTEHAIPQRLQAVRHALTFVGVKEHPPGSNTGPHIDEWQRLFGIHGEPWCGAFVGAMLHAVGHKVDKGVVYTPNIRTFALQGKGGFVLWIPREHADRARGGDLVLYDFPDRTTGIQHVEMLRQRPTNGTLHIVGGNTSAGDGSQDNGGQVAAKTRPLDQSVIGFARWWKP